jgi:hypothetical protein
MDVTVSMFACPASIVGVQCIPAHSPHIKAIIRHSYKPGGGSKSLMSFPQKTQELTISLCCMPNG